MTVDLNNLSIEENKLFNDISIDLKADFHALLDRLYDDIDCNIDWLVNSLFSRCNHFSNIFIDLCYLEFLKRTLKIKKIKRVIVRNRAQKSVFSDYCKINELDIIVDCHESLWLIAKNYLTPLHHTFLNFKTSVSMIINKDRNRIIRDYNTDEIIILDTFVIPSMISNGVYIDRYYGDLIKYLPSEIKEAVYYAPTFVGFGNISLHKVLSELKNNQFIFKFDYLRMSDYLYALTSPFRILRKRLGNYYFHGFKINTILNNDIYYNIANPSSFEGILNYLFFKRLKLSKVKIKLVIDWFENQAVDKGFNKGKNDFYPRTRSIGYEGFIVSNEYYFRHRPTKAEYLNGVVPNIIAVTGIGLCNDIRKYYNSLPVITAPAFRYNKISSAKETNYPKEKSKFIILAALPISIDYAKDIISLLNDVLSEKNNKIDRIIVNYHPSLNINLIKYLIDVWKDSYEISKESFSTLIHDVDVVVSNSSSTCVESLIYGIPVIIAGSKNGITQNPIPDTIPKYIWELCYSVDEFNLAIKRLLSTMDKNRVMKYNEIAKDIQKKYFEPVTKKGVMKFFQI